MQHVTGRKHVTLLGSTGSIGKTTLSLLAHHPDTFKVVALTAKSNIETLFQQCQQFNPIYAVVADHRYAATLRKKLHHIGLATQVLVGEQSLHMVAALPEVDYVMAAIVGAAGLQPTLAAVKAGKRVLLANKEALVMSGALFMQAAQASGAVLLPVDSEHNAIFQCLPLGYKAGNALVDVERITLTASGGPFRTLPLENFSAILPAQAIAHPTWQMGAKISVDSATMMNKGLELIEACWLFNVGVEHIEIVLHPQSIIHSLVYYTDGSILAQLGAPDMRIPIAYALSWPDRIHTPVKRLNLVQLHQLTFEPLDKERFPCVELAYAALKAGGTACTILNAANEIAVAAFLAHTIPFPAIASVIAETLQSMIIQSASSIEVVLEADQLARMKAHKIMQTFRKG